MVFKKLAKKLSLERQKRSSAVTNPLEIDFDSKESLFLNKLSQNTVNLYERQSDIKNFSELVLSDPENNSHNKLVEELIAQGVIDYGDDEKLLELSDNRRFLRDLGLTED